MIIEQLNNLQPGEQLIYYTGNLAKDISSHGLPDYDPYLSKQLLEIREEVHHLYDEGKILLVQRKVRGCPPFTPNTFNYIAIGVKNEKD